MARLFTLVFAVVVAAACDHQVRGGEESRSPTPPVIPSPSPSPSPAARGEIATVVRVIDGDTIEVSLDGGTEKVRLIGVDTPETVHPSQPVECYGRRASAFTKRHLEGETVELELDVEKRDRYGRLLAYVWLGGKLFNETLVAKGYAQLLTIPPNVEYVERFRMAQREARRSDAGLWGGCPREDEPPPDRTSGQSGNCTPGYSPCLPPASDYDCAGGSGDGPRYTGRVEVTGSDPYGLDSDNDGLGCE